MSAAGRLVIPKDLRTQLGIEDGGELQLCIVDGELRAMTPKAARIAALRRIQNEVQELGPPGLSMVDALIAERRAEAKREFGD